jgi:CBS domain-containing protein
MSSADTAPASGPPHGGPDLHLPLHRLIRRAPVCVTADASLREALTRMNDERVGSVLVTDAGRAVGILTLPDLPGRVLLPGLSLETPVAQVMSHPLHVLDGDCSGEDAARLMARHDVRHIAVTDHDQRLLGVIAQNDLYAKLRSDIRSLAGRIHAATDLDALGVVARAVRRFGLALLQDGSSAEALTLHLSALNDALTARAIDLVRAAHPDGAVFERVRWCWLAFGSEGRMEQTFVTDQDNGLVFEVPPGRDADDVRPALLRVAGEINGALAQLGFPLCEGGVMAGQPRCCLSLDEWCHAFAGWIAEPQPEALLAANIFFDLRPLHGDAVLAEVLLAEQIAQAAAGTRFLRLMAQNALRARVPLGLLGRFRIDDALDAPHTLDLKAGGARIFADCARLLALRDGIAARSTSARLRALARQGGLAGDDIEAMVRAFFFIQQLRLLRQAEGVSTSAYPAANRIDPRTLNVLDRVVLKQALVQTQRLLDRVRVDWQIP